MATQEPTAAHKVIAAGLIMLSLVYLLAFVPRGWVPHDEGMLGQAAERMLAGEVPHVDYQEPYTGGLSWMHATVFRVAGIDLLYPRWLLFAGAALAQTLTYLILRRFLAPVAAALGTWVALGWSFPNYFAALPSWWVLICALSCLWAFIKHVETGQIRYVAAAGLAAGVSILIKQTGLYLVVALGISLLYGGGTGERTTTWWPGRVICGTVAAGAAALALMLMAARLAPSDLIYLLVPILACSRVLLTSDGLGASRPVQQAYLAPLVAAAAAATPLLLFAAPYVIDGQLTTFINGVFILPQKRTQFASAEMPPAYWILAGLPLLALVMPAPARLRPSANVSRMIGATLGIGGILLVGLSLYDDGVYQAMWQSARALATLLPIAVGALLLSDPAGGDRNQRWILLGCVTMLAWAALVQLPFSAPIYFCYVTPLALIAAVAVADRTGALSRPALTAYATVIVLFAVVVLNRGYLFNLGSSYRTEVLNVPLDSARASLTVSAEQSATYRRTLDVIASHLDGGQLVAGPDSPEIYFLAGRFSPTGTFYDFFDGHVSADGAITDLPGWQSARVVVLNHARRFSFGPSGDFAARVREKFPNAEWAGGFEVRWR